MFHLRLHVSGRRRPWLQAHSAAGRTGFTFTELAVAAALLILISAASFPSIVSFYQEQRLRQAAIELQSLLLNARAVAQRQNGICSVSRATATPNLIQADPTATDNVCSRANLSNLDLAGLNGLSRLCVFTSLNSSCTAAFQVQFTSLGVLVGAPRTIFLADSGNGTLSQFCLNLSLTQLRLGSRSGSSGFCSVLQA